MQGNKEDDNGHQHASACADDGEHGLFYTGELAAAENLTLQLKAYAEEEDGHEEVVYELQEIHVLAVMAEQVESADAEAHFFLPDGLIPFLCGRQVGYDQGGYGGKDKKYAAGDVLLDHLYKGIVFFHVSI